MLQGVNIEDIKQYNSSLKQCRDRAASLKAEIEYTNKEIDTICNELSAELGITVTRDNIEQIYNDFFIPSQNKYDILHYKKH